MAQKKRLCVISFYDWIETISVLFANDIFRFLCVCLIKDFPVVNHCSITAIKLTNKLPCNLIGKLPKPSVLFLTQYFNSAHGHCLHQSWSLSSS